jgi:hypothetical protein
MEENRAAKLEREEREALPSQPRAATSVSQEGREAAAAAAAGGEGIEEVGQLLGDMLRKENEQLSESESEEEGLVMKKYQRPAPSAPEVSAAILPAAAPPARSDAASIGSTSAATSRSSDHRRSRASGRTTLTPSALSQLPYDPFLVIQRFFNPDQPWKVEIPTWWHATVVLDEKWSEKKAVEEQG